MTRRDELKKQSVPAASVYLRMLQGAGIALFLMILFLPGAGAPDPGWPNLWMFKPLLMIPLAGAIGGLLNYFMDHFRYQGGWKQAQAMLLSLIGYFVIVWFGTVVGLNGTLWD